MIANQLLVPTPDTAHHVSWCFGGGRGTAARWATGRNMAKAKFPVFVVLTLLFTTVAHAELEGRAILDESIKGFRLYKRPKLTIPVGWKEHEAAGQEIRGVVLVPNGKEPQTSEVTIHAIAVRKETPQETLDIFIKEDVENFKQNTSKGSVKELPGFNSGSSHLKAYQFSYPYNDKTYFQTVAFWEESDHLLSFTLTGISKVAHDSGLQTFKEMLSKFK
jgi:hypothetical protein